MPQILYCGDSVAAGKYPDGTSKDQSGKTITVDPPPSVAIAIAAAKKFTTVDKSEGGTSYAGSLAGTNPVNGNIAFRGEPAGTTFAQVLQADTVSTHVIMRWGGNDCNLASPPAILIPSTTFAANVVTAIGLVRARGKIPIIVGQPQLALGPMSSWYTAPVSVFYDVWGRSLTYEEVMRTLARLLNVLFIDIRNNVSFSFETTDTPDGIHSKSAYSARCSVYIGQQIQLAYFP